MNTHGSIADQRVGILLNPSSAASGYGAALIASWDAVTGASTLEIGGYATGTWHEHARFTYDGGLALGTTTDPGSGNFILTGSINLLPMTASTAPASGSVIYVVPAMATK